MSNTVDNFITPSFSKFISNDGDMGGAVSTAYVPLSFSGFNTFKANRGRSFTVGNIYTINEVSVCLSYVLICTVVEFLFFFFGFQIV